MLLSEKKLFEKIKFTLNGFSQKEIAQKLNVSTSLVTKWNKGEGRPTLETLERIVDLSGCSWDELLTGRAAVKTESNIALIEAKDEIIAGLKRENSLLREKLEGQSNNSDLVKIAEKVVEILEQRGSDSSTRGSAG